MFPIRDHNPATNTPLVTYALIAANVGVFLLYLPLFANDFALAAFFDRWAIVPARLTSGEGAHGLLTSMFLHGGWLHLIGNMLFLHIFGNNVEDRLGHLRFAAFYAAAGLGAGLIQVLAEPGSMVPVVGASGAIAGVMGGYLLMFPRARIDILIFLIVIVRILPVPAWMMLGLWFGMQVVGGATATADTSGVAYWAHAGGFVIGITLMLPVWLRLGGVAFWRNTHGTPDHPEARYRYVKTDVPAARHDPRPKQAPGNVPRVPRQR